jgi:hypothetical protein
MADKKETTALTERSVDVDVDHPALDSDLRKNATVKQNRIDLNDPTVSGQEAVERNLGYASAAPTAEEQ